MKILGTTPMTSHTRLVFEDDNGSIDDTFALNKNQWEALVNWGSLHFASESQKKIKIKLRNLGDSIEFLKQLIDVGDNEIEKIINIIQKEYFELCKIL